MTNAESLILLYLIPIIFAFYSILFPLSIISGLYKCPIVRVNFFWIRNKHLKKFDSSTRMFIAKNYFFIA